MRAPILVIACAATLLDPAHAQSPAFGQESSSFDAQALASTAQGASWTKFGGVCRDKLGRFWAVAGHPSSPATPKPGKLFVFSAAGAYAGSFDQPSAATSTFAMRDLAYDQKTDLIYGGFESAASGNVIWVLDAANAAGGWSNDTGAAGKAYKAPTGFTVHRGLAIDPVTKAMWTSDFGNNPLTEFDRQGNVLRQIPLSVFPAGFAPYGLAIDATGKRLWAFSQGGSAHTSASIPYTGFNVLIEIDIDPASASTGKPTGLMTLGSASGGGPAFYAAPVAGGAELSTYQSKTSLVLLNQGAFDVVSLLQPSPEYGTGCGGGVSASGDVPWSGNLGWGVELVGSASNQAALMFGVGGPGSLALGPPVAATGCTVLVALAPAPIVFGLVNVTAGRARQPVAIPAGLAPAAVYFQWVELDPLTSTPVKLSTGASVLVALR